MSKAETLNRNELSDLLGVKFTTYSVWQSRGWMSRATYAGGVARQSRYTADDALSAYCFVLAKQQSELELADCAVITRYLDKRPGTLKALLEESWPRPVTLTVYPTHDLTGSNLPLKRVRERAWEGFRQWKGLAEQARESGVHTRNIPDKFHDEHPRVALWSDIGVSDKSVTDEDMDKEIAEFYREKERPYRADVAVNIFRESKRLQYDNIIRPDMRPRGLDLDLSKLPLNERLMAEAWAIQYVQDALLWYGLGGFGEGEGSPHARIDVTEAVTRVAEAYDLTPDKSSESAGT